RQSGHRDRVGPCCRVLRQTRACTAGDGPDTIRQRRPAFRVRYVDGRQAWQRRLAIEVGKSDRVAARGDHEDSKRLQRAPGRKEGRPEAMTTRHRRRWLCSHLMTWAVALFLATLMGVIIEDGRLLQSAVVSAQAPSETYKNVYDGWKWW